MFPVLSVQPVHARRSLSSYHDTEYSSISLDEYSDSGSEAGKEESDWKVGTASEAQSPSQVEPLRSDTPVRVPSTFDGLSRNLGLSEHDTPASNPHIHKDSHANSHGHGTDGTLPTISEFNHVNAQLSVAGFAPISQSLEPSSTLSLVHRLVVALNALHSAHSNAQDTHSFLLSDNTILSDRVARLRREVADRDAEVLKLKELRREADDDTKVAHARIKSLERELKTLKNDFIALAQKVGGCCDNGIKNFVNSPSKAAKYGTACAKCYAKLRQSKSCTAQWIEGVGFIESENEPPSTNIISPSVGYARRRGPPPMSSMSKRPTSVPSSPFSSAIHKPIVPASKLLSYSVCSPTMAVPSLTSFQIALSPSDDFDEAIHQTRPNHRSSSASRIIPTLIPAKTVPSELGMKSSTADSATNTEDERKPLLADSSTSPEALSFTDATTETDLNIISLESLIQKQQELIESLLTDQTTPDNLSSAVKIEPTQSLADIATRYASLETERKQLTEAALELGEARGALKKEREEFFEEVRAFRTLRVLVGLDEVIGVDPPLQTVLNEQPQAAQATGVSEPLVHLARPTVPDAAARPKSAAVPEPITVSESAFVPELYAVIEEAPTTAVVAPTSPQIDADTTLFLDSSPTSPSSVPAPTSPTPSPHKIVLRPSTRSLIASYENFKSFRPLTPHETPIVATHAVVRAYAPSNYTDEIALARGDLVHVERVFADSWCLVVHLSAGRKDLRGVVPLGCLKEVHGGASRVCVMEEGDGERSWVGAVRSAGRSVRFREKVEEIASWWGRERVESLEALADAKK